MAIYARAASKALPIKSWCWLDMTRSDSWNNLLYARSPDPSFLGLGGVACETNWIMGYFISQTLIVCKTPTFGLNFDWIFMLWLLTDNSLDPFICMQVDLCLYQTSYPLVRGQSIQKRMFVGWWVTVPSLDLPSRKTLRLDYCRLGLIKATPFRYALKMCVHVYTMFILIERKLNK